MIVRRTTLKVVLAVSMMFLTLLSPNLFVQTVKAETSGKYLDNNPSWNGMQITYSFSGVTVTNFQDTGTTYVERIYSGNANAGDTVTVSGSFHFDWKYPASADVSITAGSGQQSASFDLTNNDSRPTIDQPFSLILKIPNDALYVSFTIEESSSYLGRGLSLTGSFEVGGTTTPMPTETPTPAPTPTSTAYKPPGNPTPIPSIMFTSISREVEIRRADAGPYDWQAAKMDTVLYAGDHVRTGEDSTAILGFGDLSTFQLKPESEIEITTHPVKDSKIGLVAGNIWVNVKRMMNGGTLEVDMTWIAMSVKGTVFEAQSSDTESTVKGIVDVVTVTSLATGETTDIGPGQMVSGTNYGLGSVTTFDVSNEAASWGISLDNGQPNNLPLIIGVGIGGAIVAVVCVILGVSHLRKRSKQQYNPDFSPPNPPPPPPS